MDELLPGSYLSLQITRHLLLSIGLVLFIPSLHRYLCRSHPHIPLNLDPSIVILEGIRRVHNGKVKSPDDLSHTHTNQLDKSHNSN